MPSALPISLEKLEEIAQKYGTPFHLYDEKIIKNRAQKLKNAFKKTNGFRQYFAVKGNPNPQILKIFSAEGFGMDTSSIAELELCKRIGISGENIMFSSNGTSILDFQKAYELGAIINIDDISLIDILREAVPKFPELICFRINPGNLKKGNEIIGNPIEAKFGITMDQILPAYRKAQELGAKRFGIHTMTGSNMLDEQYFPETAILLSNIALQLQKELGITVEFINIGGGFGIPYRPNDHDLDIEKIGSDIEKVLHTTFGENPPKLFTESGRWPIGPAGWLVTRVNNKKEIYKKYAVMDACMADLMRPGMYGAYHHITVPGKENENTEKIDVVGSLCENNDKFAIDRELPKLERGDLLVIHDTGAHGRAMCFNYNGKLRTQEVLLQEDGTTRLIRRKETLEDYFATLLF